MFSFLADEYNDLYRVEVVNSQLNNFDINDSKQYWNINSEYVIDYKVFGTPFEVTNGLSTYQLQKVLVNNLDIESLKEHSVPITLYGGVM